MEGEGISKVCNAAFVETSAKDNINVGRSIFPSFLYMFFPFYSIRFLPGLVFELALGEIEKRSPTSHAEPQTTRCVVM
jgi:Ras family protein